MNERNRELIGYIDVNAKIRELAERSGCSIDRLGYGEGNLEKFAELIVQDCLAVIEKRMDLGTDERCREECKALIAEIKQQYGVE